MCSNNVLRCIGIYLQCIAIDLECITINVLSFYIDFTDPPALRLVCMMDQAIHRCIDAWWDDPRCTEVLTLGRLPPQQQLTDQDTAAPPTDQQG